MSSLCSGVCWRPIGFFPLALTCANQMHRKYRDCPRPRIYCGIERGLPSTILCVFFSRHMHDTNVSRSCQEPGLCVRRDEVLYQSKLLIFLSSWKVFHGTFLSDVPFPSNDRSHVSTCCRRQPVPSPPSTVTRPQSNPNPSSRRHLLFPPSHPRSPLPLRSATPPPNSLPQLLFRDE